MRVVLGIVGVALFAGALILGFYLLEIGKLSGAEFTAFVIAFAVFSLVICYAPEVQEISIAGSVVKLKEVKAEALSAIESLNKSRVEMLRVFLNLALRQDGGFANENPVDPRGKNFWLLIGLAEEYKCREELKSELLLAVKSLMHGQLLVIMQRTTSVKWAWGEEFLSPFQLAATAFNPVGIEQSVSRRSPRPSEEDYKKDIQVSLEEYSKFYRVMTDLEAID